MPSQQVCLHGKIDTSDGLMSACTGMVRHVHLCGLVEAWMRLEQLATIDS